jgi:hypothetical protein
MHVSQADINRGSCLAIRVLAGSGRRPSGRRGVLPVPAGVAPQQHPAQRRHYLEAVGAYLATDRVDHDVEALPAEGRAGLRWRSL